MTQSVYIFGETEEDLTLEAGKELLGGKGAALDQMTKLGLPIPPGFTISTATCIEFLQNDNTFPEGMWDAVESALSSIEQRIGKNFGNSEKLLLLSVRSGAKISMPGMMDTILNLGLNNAILEQVAGKGEERFLLDSYRRLILMFSNVVVGLEVQPFEKALEEVKFIAGVKEDHELGIDHLKEIISQYQAIFKKGYGEDFPQEPKVQLRLAIESVFKSWNNRRAVAYRIFEGIPHDIGTAVNVQAMVFGNFDDNSGTGVMFTRSPSTGENQIYGEFLLNAQGEDVVAGLRTPLPIYKLEEQMPEVYRQLKETAHKLEEYYKDMQDIEFTIENGHLYILQTRAGKRTGAAAARIADEFVKEGILSKEEAVMRITPRDIESSLFPSVVWKDPKKYLYYVVDDLEKKLEKDSLTEITKHADYEQAHYLGQGLPAGPGAAVGHVVFSSDEAEAIVQGELEPPFEVQHFRTHEGRKIPSLILIKKETSPEDFHGMVASSGILTMTGGMTSHAALVGRQIGKRVIVGASNSKMDLYGNKLQTADGTLLSMGDVISMEIFEEGLVFKGALPIYTPTDLSLELQEILDWADEMAEIKVRANADQEGDTLKALAFKSTGTGLARTEHMFFDALDKMQAMIMSETKEERLASLAEMQKLQRADFVKIF
ncbi:MAG: PEP/pyruvate-binding domain-containing protein, partial [Candidatus Kariarchaeaceae archaeon]